MKRKNIATIVSFFIILYFFNSFTLCAGGEKKESYLLKNKSKSAGYELYFNGFLISCNKKISSAYVGCFLRRGKNKITVDIMDGITDNHEVINVTIEKITMIGEKSTSNTVLSWNITLEQGKKSYGKEIEIKGVGENLPWEKADKIEILTAKDIREIKSMTSIYKNTLKKGNKEQIVKMLIADCQFRMKAESMLANEPEAVMVKQFMAIYDILFAPPVRGNVYEYKQGELDIFKSPHDDRIAIVKTKTQKPIIKIETQSDDEEKSSSGLSKSNLYFIKVAGKWYIY